MSDKLTVFSKTEFKLSCSKNSDGNNYLITTQNINKSNTIKLNYINNQIFKAEL